MVDLYILIRPKIKLFVLPLIQRTMTKYLKPVYLTCNANILDALSGSYLVH